MISKSFKIDTQGVMQNAPQHLQSNSLIIFFSYNDEKIIGNHFKILKNQYPQATIIGCSAGFQIFETEINTLETSVLALTFENSHFTLATNSTQITSFERGVDIAKQLIAEDLKGIFVLTDGLNINGSEFIAGMHAKLGKDIPITGGMAGDAADFKQTFVAANNMPQQGAIAAIGFYGDKISLKSGNGGGWSEFGPKRVITKASNNVLYELDGKPALDLYEKYLGDEAQGLPSSGLLFPLKIINPEDTSHDIVRTILSIDREAKSMTFAGTMNEGWNAQLMRGTFENLIQSARTAAQQAQQEHSSVAISVSCIGRKLLLGQKSIEEVVEVQQILGNNTPLIGFYSYGEFSPHFQSGISDLHNQTMTLLTIQERLTA